MQLIPVTAFQGYRQLVHNSHSGPQQLATLLGRSVMSSSSLALINEIITNPAYHDYLAVLKGARNGFVYGVKVRFPHALVMSILFGRGDWKSRAKVIYRASRQHAMNLAKFVSIYKSLLLVQKKLNGGKERDTDTFIAGLLGGYFVFGDRNAVNEQIVLYVVSRVVASFIPRATQPYNAASGSTRAGSAVKPIPPNSRYFTVFAALSWGAVMYLFRHRGETIQPGMFNSMTYLYRDSDVWRDLKTLLWHNT
ncbi:Tim17/Tim22/Tim23/Pmp24 family-domain-containing protein [Crepidotus variabilis]|uniref:Tim17/Tim22/Tim23/Pmp24 family-domain-containing protein n=1 Tax=Crepidotus variabilis TaxID=179855 RepID=A0A9P6EUX6_9AGAR|nr:Tim17/Tim22/Tim23/Pmp24 family-domain-containing protein [Crepidotus variabilis]